MRPTCADLTAVIRDPADAAVRRRAVAAILARGVARLLAPPPRATLSAGRSSTNLAVYPASELALTAKQSVTVHAGLPRPSLLKTEKVDESLVVVAEFYRSPKVTRSISGRKHWSDHYAVLFDGCGIRGGQV